VNGPWRAPLAVVAGAAAYGMVDAGNGFGQFLLYGLMILVISPLALFLGVATLVAVIRRRPATDLPLFLAVVAVLGLIPTAGYLLAWPRDQLWFLLWSFGHEEALARREVLREWDAWGIAGMTNVAFLVSDPGDALTLDVASALWGGEGCDVVALRRLRRGVYVVTTLNCSLPEGPW
jgi:hypothetical protein